MRQPARKSFTLIIVPEASSRLHKVHLPIRGIYIVAIAGFALFCTAAGMGFRYARMRFETSNFNALQAENARLKVEKKNFELSTEKLNAQLNKVEALSQEVTSLAETSGMAKGYARSGIGGSAIDRSTEDLLRNMTPDSDVESLKTRMDRLQNQMTLLHQKMGFRISRARVTPDIWPLHGSILSPFGPRSDPFGEGTEFHEGLDISGAYGAPVRATADGTVLFAGRQSDYGNLIIIDHGNGITTRFGHLSRFQVLAGHFVKKDDIVGYVGMTGRTTGPHLHYEVRVNDRPVNPRGYLPREDGLAMR